jgi:hypothetical protein
VKFIIFGKVDLSTDWWNYWIHSATDIRGGIDDGLSVGCVEEVGERTGWEIGEWGWGGGSCTENHKLLSRNTKILQKITKKRNLNNQS